MSVFFANTGFVFCILVVLGGCGWFAVAPFRIQLRHALLAAPHAGLLALVTGTLAGYVFLKLPMKDAAGLACIGLVALGGASLVIQRPRLSFSDLLFPLAVALLISAATAAMCTAASIWCGGPALLFMDGTDHLGYAQAVDWLNHHRVTQPPVYDPGLPYEYKPARILSFDPRGGAYVFLALISLASGESGMFSYDLATACALAVGILGVAAVFSRSRTTLVLLLGGLLTSHWFDHGQSGYLGKLLNYPANIFLLGLFFITVSGAITPFLTLILCALAAGTALLLSGMVSAAFVLVLGGFFLLHRWAYQRDEESGPARRKLQEGAALLVLLAGVMLVTSGTLARPFAIPYPKYDLSWSYLWPRLMDLEYQATDITRRLVPAGLVTGMAIAMFAGWLALGILAWRRRLSAAATLVFGPLLVLLGLRLGGGTSVALQLMGTFYPLALGSAVILFDDRPVGTPPSRAKLLCVPLGVLGLAIVLHGPFFAASLTRFCRMRNPPALCFTKSQLDQLASAIGSSRVLVDITQDRPQLNPVLVVELGRRGVALEWTPATWHEIFNPHWAPPPEPATPAPYRIVSATRKDPPPGTVVLRTFQYLLIKQDGS